MAKHWVLDTETKGTGARMVPLEDTPREQGGESAPVVVRAQPPRPPAAALPTGPRRFKLVDAMSRCVLAEGVDARTIVSLLVDVRSVVDVSLYVWEPGDERWRPLTYSEKKLMWGFREP